MTKPKMKVGDKIVTEYGQGRDGKWYWRVEGEKDIHGPFATNKAAERDSEITLYGPDCEFRHGGQWDPAWDQMQ